MARSTRRRSLPAAPPEVPKVPPIAPEVLAGLRERFRQQEDPVSQEMRFRRYVEALLPYAIEHAETLEDYGTPEELSRLRELMEAERAASDAAFHRFREEADILDQAISARREAEELRAKGNQTGAEVVLRRSEERARELRLARAALDAAGWPDLRFGLSNAVLTLFADDRDFERLVAGWPILVRHLEQTLPGVVMDVKVVYRITQGSPFWENSDGEACPNDGITHHAVEL